MREDLSNTSLLPGLGAPLHPIGSHEAEDTGEHKSWFLDPAVWEEKSTLDQVGKCFLSGPNCIPDTFVKDGFSLLLPSYFRPGSYFFPFQRVWFCSINCLLHNLKKPEDQSPSDLN